MMGVLICGVDYETTGLSAIDDRITEIGACLYDWDTGTPLKLMSTLVNPERPIPEEIVKLTGITDELVDLYGKSEKVAFAELHDLMSYSDYAMAFNGSRFDYLFYLAACKRLEVEPSGIFWLDASSDVKYPEAIKTRNLRHLASEHNFLNPFAHRAIFDVLTMFKVAGNYRLDDIIARAQEPTLCVQALVSFDEKELAKARGYRWYAPSKIWWREWKASDYEADKLECGFRTQLLTKAPE
jgi:DNA polymerase-3 subunit epsilon